MIGMALRCPVSDISGKATAQTVQPDGEPHDNGWAMGGLFNWAVNIALSSVGVGGAVFSVDGESVGSLTIFPTPAI